MLLGEGEDAEDQEEEEGEQGGDNGEGCSCSLSFTLSPVHMCLFGLMKAKRENANESNLHRCVLSRSFSFLVLVFCLCSLFPHLPRMFVCLQDSDFDPSDSETDEEEWGSGSDEVDEDEVIVCPRVNPY